MNILETQLATVAGGDTLTGTEAQSASADATAQNDTYGFTANDLALLEKSGNDAPKLREAAYLLLELATEKPVYSMPNERFGRFSFCSYSASAAQLRAAFQVLRRSLDFLEADFLACEAEQIQFLESELAKFRALDEAA